MARTLADMTPEEREQCVGMWANISSRDELFIIDSVDSETALIFIPGDSPDACLVDFDFITPRVDLPRAWNPDGTPVKGKWENTRTPDNPHDPLLRRRFISEYEGRTND